MATAHSGVTLLCDRDGIVASIAVETLGIGRVLQVGRPFADCAWEDNADRAQELIARICSDGFACEVPLVLSVAQKPQLVNFSGGRIGEQIALIGGLPGDSALFFEDIIKVNNEQSNALRSALKNLEARTRQAGIVAHDLRNTLGAITSGIELMREGESQLSPYLLEIAELIERASEASLTLVSDLFDFTLLTSGRLELHLKETDLAILLGQNVSTNHRLAEKKHIELEAQVAPDLPCLSIDPARIQQVLTNFVTNAIKYSQPGTKVIVRATSSDAQVLVEVVDQGPGIPADEAKRLFHEYQKASPRPTAGEPSTGLGLAIARRIVESHGGRIGVDSTVGVGSNFYFTLPRNPADAARAKAEPSTTHEALR
jgi:signal transduction histidine kinase